MPNTIDFKLNSWLENAGIIGLTRIVQKSTYTIKNNILHLDQDELPNLAHDYFDYFINTYGKYLRYYRLVSMKNTLLDWQDQGLDNFTEDELKYLITWFDDVLKHNMNLKTYKTVIKFLNDDFDVTAVFKQCNALMRTLKKKNAFTKKHDEVIQTLSTLIPKLLQIIAYFEKPNASKHFQANMLANRIIENAWTGAAFLDRANNKEPDIYRSFTNYFVQPVIDYLQADHSKDQYFCSNCGRKVGKERRTYTFLNGMGYNPTKKQSNGWNYNNDLYVCPICYLMYACTSAGFTYNMNHDGIFVNNNKSVKILKHTNDAILETMTTDLANSSNTSVYQSFIKAYHHELASNSRYMLANIQMIKYQNDHYTFQIIPEVGAKVLKYATDMTLKNGEPLLDTLYSIGITNFNGQNYYSLFDEIINCLFNNTNLTPLIQILEQLKATDTAGCYYNVSHIINIIHINSEFINQIIKRQGDKQTMIDQKEINQMRHQGVQMKESYTNKSNANKAQALAYRMLNALRVNNTDAFMDLLLNACLYQNCYVPNSFLTTKHNPQVFKEYGYAFVAGLIGQKEVDATK